MSPAADVQDQVTVIFATVDRPECVDRLHKSIRVTYPRMAILIGDQSEEPAAPKRLMRDKRTTVVRMPHDAGVCATRNALVAKVATPYFVLCDDDFVWSEETNFRDALNLMAADPTIAVVGGKLYDIYSPTLNKASPRHWERYLHLDPSRRHLLLLPLEATQPRPTRVGRSIGYDVDAVLNFALMRTSAFGDNGLRWDPIFKSNGEHEDFYLSVKKSEHRVLYCPTMVAYHYSVTSPNYDQKRNRTAGWQHFSRKWDVDLIVDGRWTVELSTGQRTASPANHEEFEAVGARLAGMPEVPPGFIGVTPDGDIYLTPRPANTSAAGGQGADALARELQAIRASTSWRITAPLRRFTTVLRRIRNRIAAIG